MTVLLVILSAVVLLTLDYFYSRRRVVQRAVVPAVQARSSVVPLRQPDIVDGFKVPSYLAYHPGHSWVLSESPNLVRAGMDHFAASLIGRVDKVDLPRRGQWIRQGQKAWTLYRDGRKVEIASPIEGVVTDVNDAVTLEPELARRDPYGEGWLMTVQAPDAKTNFRNLLSGVLVRRWMEESALRLRSKLPPIAGLVAQDGGLAIDDLGSLLSDEVWSELTREFFLN